MTRAAAHRVLVPNLSRPRTAAAPVTNPVAALSIQARAENSILTALSLNIRVWRLVCLRYSCRMLQLKQPASPETASLIKRRRFHTDLPGLNDLGRVFSEQTGCVADSLSAVRAGSTVHMTDTFRSYLKGIDTPGSEF